MAQYAPISYLYALLLVIAFIGGTIAILSRFGIRMRRDLKESGDRKLHAEEAHATHEEGPGKKAG